MPYRNDGTRRSHSSLRGVLAIATTAILVSLGSFIGAESAWADPVPPASVIDQQNTVGNTCSTNQTFGQSFPAGITGELTAVGIDVRTNDSGSTEVRVEATTGGLPNGTVLGTGTYSGAFTGVVAMQTPFPVVAGTTYALILSGQLAFGCSFFDPYAGGIYMETYTGPWTPQASLDMVFSTYVRPAGIPQISDVSASTSEGVPVGIPLVETGVGITGHTIATAAVNGTVTFAGSTATYTPNALYSGTDTFTYFATNAAGDSIPATVTVTVVAAAASPLQPAASGAATLPATGADGSALLMMGLSSIALLGCGTIALLVGVRRRSF